MSNVKKYCEIAQQDNGLYSVSKFAQSVLNGQDETSGDAEEAFISTEKSVDLLTRKCRDMVENAKSEIKTQVEEAYKKGYRQGYDESYKQAYADEAAKFDSEGNKSVSLLAEFDKKLDELAAENAKKNDHLQDAILLSKTIIKTELSENSEAIFGLYKKAASHISNVTTATLKVSERNKELVEKNLPKYIDRIDGLQELKVVANSKDDGECVLETSLGNIDASADKQFARAEKIMMPQN